MILKSFSIFVFFLGVILLPFAQSNSNLAKHYKDQEKACQEFDRCMTKLANRKNRPESAIKLIDLGSNVPALEFPRFLCSLKSNCKKERHAVCAPHYAWNGTIEMKVGCKLLWPAGDEETDIDDPISLTFCDGEEDQNLACSNYDKCMELPTSKFQTLAILPHFEAVSHILQRAKQVLCGLRTNCLKILRFLCDKEKTEDRSHKMGKITAVTCSIYLSAEEAQNSMGSRSLGGSGIAKTMEVLSEFCHSTKDGVCSLD